jgi:hypothetical protein
MAGGAICTLVGGAWTFAVHKSYATEVSIYAFLIGYFMVRDQQPSKQETFLTTILRN